MPTSVRRGRRTFGGAAFAGSDVIGVVRHVALQYDARQDADVAGDHEDVGVVDVVVISHVVVVADADMRGAEAVLQADVDDVDLGGLEKGIAVLVAGAEREAAEAEQNASRHN